MGNHPFKVHNDFNYGLQKAVYSTFKQPKGSLVSKAVTKIDDYEQNEVNKYHYGVSILMKRVIAVSMPIFAFLDIFRFVGVCAFKIITLHPCHALYASMKCVKSFQIFFTSIIALPFVLIMPLKIYRTSRLQVEKLQQRLSKKMQQRISHKDSNEIIKEKLIAFAKKRLNGKNNISLLKYMASELTEAKTITNSDKTATEFPAILPPHSDTKREVVLEEYIKLYAFIITYCTTEKISLDQGNDDFSKVFTEALKFKNPEKRQMVFSSLLEIVKNDGKILPELPLEVQGLVKNHYTLPLFALHQITDDKQILSRFVTALSGDYFTHDKNIRTGELTGYLQLIDACNIPDKQKKQALNTLIQHLEASEVLFENEKQQKIQAQHAREKLSRGVEELQESLEKELASLAGFEEDTQLFKTLYSDLRSTDDENKHKEFVSTAEEQYSARSLQKIKENKRLPERKLPDMIKRAETENKQLFAEILEIGPDKKLPRTVANLPGKLRKAKSNIKKLEARIRAHETENQEDLSAEKIQDPTEFVKNGIKNFTMVLSLNNSALIASILDNVGEDKKYKHLGVREIVTDLFTTTFELSNIDPHVLYEALEHLRAPAALIKYHHRIKRYKSKRRNAIIQANKSIVESVIAGTFWKDRHKIEGNIHLQKVFNGRPELQKQWTTPEVTTVGSLIPDVSSKYANLKVIDATDPSDILKVGDDLNSCVNLDGRLRKIIGMLGLVKDGKNHSLLVKSDDGVSLAETQLQLLWDKRNNKPVLYLEGARYIGKKENDHTLQTALINFAIEKAKKMGLDLVSQWDTHEENKTILGSSYKGTVSSLGSSSPIELVDTLRQNFTTPYSMGKSYMIYQHKKV
jgi:hypothetical protein